MKKLSEGVFSAIRTASFGGAAPPMRVVEAFVDMSDAIEDAADRLRSRAVRLGWSDRVISGMLEDYDKSLLVGLPLCESPIERLVLPDLLVADYTDDGRPAVVRVPSDFRPLPSDAVVIIPQMPFLDYRFDFAVKIRIDVNTHWYAYECDGAEFHSAASDAPRDRRVGSWGIETVRVTGSEIQSCASRSADQLAYRVRARLGR